MLTIRDGPLAVGYSEYLFILILSKYHAIINITLLSYNYCHRIIEKEHSYIIMLYIVTYCYEDVWLTLLSLCYERDLLIPDYE